MVMKMMNKFADHKIWKKFNNNLVDLYKFKLFRVPEFKMEFLYKIIL